MLDEATGVARATRLLAQPGLQDGERTELPEPGLEDNERDSSQVREPKPQAVHPPPARVVAEHDHGKPADDEHNNREVNDKNDVGKELVRHGRDALRAAYRITRAACSGMPGHLH